MHARTGPGFAVLYRWRLHPGKEQQFIDAWSEVSRLLLQDRGSLGSRLHRGLDDTWYSYAQWPSAAARAHAFSLPSVAPEAMARMRDAISESFPDIVLASVADFLVLGSMSANKPASPASSGPDLPRVEAHGVKPHES